MKIVGIGKNYVNDIKDMPENEVTPLIFTKPESSLLTGDADLTLPAVSNEVWYEIELAFRVGKTCKDATREDALSYLDGIALANDLTAKDVLSASREGKGPWALAKGFDGATPIGEFEDIANYPDIYDINFSLVVNGEKRQNGNSSLMITKLEQLIEYVSKFMTLNPGDILLTGTPAHGVTSLKSGDDLVGYIEDKVKLKTKVL